MATLTAGYSFGATETVTNTKLGTLVTGGGVSSIAQADLAASQGLVFTGTTAPTDTDQIWVDTNSTPPIIRYYDSTNSQWVLVSEMALMTNKSSQTGSAGRVLILDTSNANSYTYTSTAGDTKFVGIELASTTNNSAGPVCSKSLGVTVLLEQSASAGTFLRTSTATGKAEPCANTAAGIFGFLTESGTASGKSVVGAVQVNSTVNLATAYTWTGAHTFNSTITINTASATTTNWTPIVQIIHSDFTASALSSATTPDDNTQPLWAEGVEWMWASITPKNSVNKIVADINMVFSCNAQTHYTVSLHQASGAALAAWHGEIRAASLANTFSTRYVVASAGATAAQQFSVRVGPTSGTLAFNSDGTTGLYGGYCKSNIILTEHKV